MSNRVASQAIMCAGTDADMTSHAESLLFSGLPDRDWWRSTKFPT